MPMLVKEEIRLYSSQIIKAGALLEDTSIFLSLWRKDLFMEENLRRFRQENLLGKGSRARVDEMLVAFRKRYLVSEDLIQSLSSLLKQSFRTKGLDKILYYYTLHADLLLQDVVLDYVLPAYKSGKMEMTVDGLQGQLSSYVREGKTAGIWSEPTLRRIARGILSTLRDFGLLKGRVKKSIAPPYLPTGAFSFIAFDLHFQGLSGQGLLNAREWSFFLLDKRSVERSFFEAHQRHFLEFQAAGSMVRIHFPAASRKEYANVLAGAVD
ncbi:MAG: DUF1819 family protein [Planctomycetes bacterium]|nr:DUF1819 family protein [Planctomycetota bacterium]